MDVVLLVSSEELKSGLRGDAAALSAWSDGTLVAVRGSTESELPPDDRRLGEWTVQ